MLRANDFRKKTRETLAKRAGQRCSNPNCKKPTVGPHTVDDKSVDVGEASHIRGARPGSKRYEISMTPEERRNIINGIWLCRSCAKLIDSDEQKYTIDLLYMWKRLHESEIEKSLSGGTLIQRTSIEKRLKPFENEAPAAYQIAIDKPEYWEVFLTVELLRAKISIIKRKFDDLHRGLVYRPSKSLNSKEELRVWILEKLADFTTIIQLFVVATNDALVSAWGELGQPGDALEILHVTNTIANGCQGLLDWEIDVQFTRFPSGFEKLKTMMVGWTRSTLNQVERYHKEISDIFNDNPNPTGTFHININLESPKNIYEFNKEFHKLWDMN